MPLISIVLPVYNGEKYLRECIESVTAQTFTDWELIIVDDGSKDSSLEICSSFAENDKRIKLIHQENAGVSAARNNAMKNVTGEYVTFIDCDDLYTEDRLEVMLELIRKNPDCDCVYCDYYEIKDDNDVVGQNESIEIKVLSHDENVDNILLYQKLNSVWRYMLRADTAKKIIFNSLKFCEDYFYLLEYAALTGKALYTNQKLYYYRKNNAASMTNNSRNERYLNDYKIIPQLVYGFIEKNNLSGKKYRHKLAREYAYSSVRIKRILSFREFVKAMNEPEYRKGLSYAEFDVNNKTKGLLYLLVKLKFYIPFFFI